MTMDHVRKLERGFFGQIKIECTESFDKRHEVKNGIVLNIIRPLFPKKVKYTSFITPQNSTRYVHLLHFWEQMTMNLRSLVTMAGQAKLGNRKVVKPGVRHSHFFGKGGLPLETFFNVTHLNNLLAQFGYAVLVNKREYDTA